jgi:hypothetical protein
MGDRMKPLIGLSGYQQSGKSTVARFLVRMYGFRQVAFAEMIKVAIARLLWIHKEQVDELKLDGYVIVNIGRKEVGRLSGREFLQRFGTEMGRETFGEDFWLNLAMKDIKPVLQPTVVPDVRFPNEVKAIRDVGGKIVWIERPGKIEDGHVSEKRFADPDYTIVNDGDKIDLFLKVARMMEELYGIEVEATE